MKKKQSLLLMLCALLVITLITACSNNNANQGTEASSPPPSETAATEPEASADPFAEKHTITMATGTYANPVPANEGAGIDAINEKFNVDYKVSMTPMAQWNEVLPVRIAGGNVPDLIGMNATTNFVSWAKEGAFLPLNDFLNQDIYESFKLVPQRVWDQMSVDGQIYGIPKYFASSYGRMPMIRQDWLDNLGLSMPTNYEELKAVAIAFTNDDPDQNGQDDTYGIGLASNLLFDYALGGQWSPQAFINKNAEGQLIPGEITEQGRERIQFLRDLYEAGAIPRDWAVTPLADTRKHFFSGQFGIYEDQAYDRGSASYKALAEISPNARLSVIPPFVGSDGQSGYLALGGFNGFWVLSAELKDQPEKVERILRMLDSSRTFIPVDEQNPDNEHFDWMNGYVGQGYTYSEVEGVLQNAEDVAKRPNAYLDIPWPAKDEDLEIGATATNPLQKTFIDSVVELQKKTKKAIDPNTRISSPLFTELYWGPLSTFMRDEGTKIVLGQRDIADWDNIVNEYLTKLRGQEMIDEVNRLINEAGIQPEFQ